MDNEAIGLMVTMIFMTGMITGALLNHWMNESRQDDLQAPDQVCDTTTWK